MARKSSIGDHYWRHCVHFANHKKQQSNQLNEKQESKTFIIYHEEAHLMFFDISKSRSNSSLCLRRPRLLEAGSV